MSLLPTRGRYSKGAYVWRICASSPPSSPGPKYPCAMYPERLREFSRSLDLSRWATRARRVDGALELRYPLVEDSRLMRAAALRCSVPMTVSE